MRFKGASHIMRFKGEAQEEAKRNMLEYLRLLEGALNELSIYAATATAAAQDFAKTISAKMIL